jgi:hypothetical protein
MPDTKRGRERNGKNKRRQLVERQYEAELERLEDEEDLPEFDEFVAEESRSGED